MKRALTPMIYLATGLLMAVGFIIAVSCDLFHHHRRSNAIDSEYTIRGVHEVVTRLEAEIGL